jgi:hypothetical protein
VRQLRNTLEKLFVLGRGATINGEDVAVLLNADSQRGEAR